jgi:hypothetical protein
MAFISLLWFVLAQQPAQLPPIGIVDFYGVRTVPVAELRKALPLQEGQTLSADAAERRKQLAEAVTALRKLSNVSDARVKAICCDQNKIIIYVGIQERGDLAMQFAEAPVGTSRLPQVVTETAKQLDAASMQAVLSGNAEEDDSNGYALAKDPASRALQERYVLFAKQYGDQLREVLRHSSDAQQRAEAAEVLGYSADKQSAVADLLAAMHDPNEVVRNDAMRALGVMAQYARANPQSHLKIAEDGFVEMLNSLDWTDRNKSSFVLGGLTASRDPALMTLLRERALPSLLEMAHWKFDGHANDAFYILGRVAGLPETEIDKAWDNGDRSAVFLAANKLQDATTAK